jgi:hypothetical protein
LCPLERNIETISLIYHHIKKGSYMPKQFFIDGRVQNGLKYEDYFEAAVKKSGTVNPSELTEEEKEHLEYTNLNIKRSERIHKIYNVSDDLKTALNKITKPQLWMVISGIWCGDSAQNLPYIAKMASVNPLIDLRILLRDENPDIMDEYLTNGTRSIPKLVSFDTEGNELFQWGPRPKEAVELVQKAKSEGKNKDQFIEELHLWYGRNRGKAIESEFLTILK